MYHRYLMPDKIMRGDLWLADLSPIVGSEQGGIRPVLILSNNLGNESGPTVIAAAITSQNGKPDLPTHTTIHSYCLPKKSIVLLEQIRTIDKRRLREHMGRVDEQVMRRVDNAIAVSFGLNPERLI